MIPMVKNGATEERRPLYVAMTRAKDDLHLIIPQRFFTHGQNAQGDRHVYASRTRFIPDGLLNLFNKTAWPVIAAGSAGCGAQAKACASMPAPACAACGDEEAGLCATCIR
jgi:DNA helicase II / ATP-dependent DNA helicase PcrA